MSERGVPGLSIAFIEDGQPSHIRSWGYANTENRTKATPRTAYNVASVSKTLTAWGIMKLVEEGKINLDSPVSQYLSRWELPPSEFDRSKVTLRRILSHSSGLSYGGGYAGYDLNEDLPSLEDSLNGLTKSHAILGYEPGRQTHGVLYARHEPGTVGKYSNGGFSLAQLIIEEVSGQRYADFMREQILLPLGMRDSSFDVTPDVIERSATPYFGRYKFKFAAKLKQFLEAGVGGLYTTPKDLSLYVAALFEGPDGEPVGRGVLRPETVQEMLTIQTPHLGNHKFGIGYRQADFNS